MAGDYGSRLEALVKKNNPEWKPGDSFDTNILDQLDGTMGGVDETSEAGYRKMTMEEELGGLDKAFQKAADGTDIKEMITGEFERLSVKVGSKQTSFSESDKKAYRLDIKI